MSGFYIGNVHVNGRTALGPMAGVTDLPFRVLCKECGVDLLYTEMISAKGMMYNNKNTTDLMRVDDIEHPISLQLFGNDPKIMSEQAKRFEECNFDILDINMGCPVPKIVGNGEGSALLKNPVLIGQIVEAISKAISKPVTIKIRKGYEDGENVAAEIAHVAQESGAAAVCVHARTRSQFYSGQADWSVIREVKEKVRIPVIGNGDITSGADAARMISETGCDAVMVGRAAQGNPWIFKEIKAYLEEGRVIEKPSDREVIDMVLKHARLQIELKGEENGMREMRKHAAWYMSGRPNSAKLRAESNEVTNYAALEEMLERWFCNK